MNNINNNNIHCQFCNEEMIGELYPSHILQCLFNSIHSRIYNFNNNFNNNINSNIYNDSNENENENENINSNLTHIFNIDENELPLLWFNLNPIYSFDNYPVYNDFDNYENNIALAEIIGSVELGFTKEQIDEVSIINDIEDEVNIIDEICPICLDDINKCEKVRRLKCNHIFCDLCISTWLERKKKCPYCQINLEDNFLLKN